MFKNENLEYEYIYIYIFMKYLFKENSLVNWYLAEILNLFNGNTILWKIYDLQNQKVLPCENRYIS